MEEKDLGLSPADVHLILKKYMLADGMDLVMDLHKSQGSRIFNSRDNSWYLDFFGCFATIALGYNHPGMCSPEAVETLGRAAIQKPSNSDIYSLEMASFVDTMGRVAVPSFMKHVFFISGGALAVENALKAAFDWKVRRNFTKGITEEKGYQVIHFKQSFHGRSGYTLSLTNTADPRKTQYYPKFDWPRILNPKCTFPLEGENLTRVIRDEEEAVNQIMTAIERNPDDIAAIILEPIQGEGGDNHFRPEFHKTLRRICDENDILLIYDEVQTGMGVTGKMWACEHYCEPDMIVFGKKVQVCGLMAGKRIDEVPDNVFQVSSRINSTWGGNLVDMVRSRMHLEIFEQENTVSECNRLGVLLMERLANLQELYPDLVSNIRGKGLFCAVDLPDKDYRNRFLEKLYARNLLMLGCGERAIRFRTALNIPEDDLMEGVRIIEETLAEERS